MKNLNTLSIEEVETIHNYLENNPQEDRYDQPVEMDDLDIDKEGNIVYAFSWKTRTDYDSGTGYNSVVENYDEQYAILLTKEQLKNELNSKQQNEKIN